MAEATIFSDGDILRNLRYGHKINKNDTMQISTVCIVSSCLIEYHASISFLEEKEVDFFGDLAFKGRGIE